MEKNRFQVKVELPNGDHHRFSIVPSFLFNSLCTYLMEISNLSDIAITYLDEEGDQITLGAEDEFIEAKRSLDLGAIVTLQLKVTAGPNAKPFKKPDQESRPQPTPRSAPGRPGKCRRGGYYAELAEEVRESLHTNTPKQPQALNRASQTDIHLKNTLAEMKKLDLNKEREQSSEWKSSFVAKASKEITSVLETLLHAPENEPSSLLNIAPYETSHIGIKCNQCNKTIAGNRYKCGNCVEYDVCELCLLTDVHDPTHVFLLLRVPCPTAGYREGRAVPLLSENLYRFEGKGEDSLWRGAGSGEQLDRLGVGTQTGLNKKLKKVIKMEKKMRKVFPRYVEAQVDLNSDIQHLRKKIDDMKDHMKTTPTVCHSPPLLEENRQQSLSAPLTQEYNAVVVRDKEECAVLPPCSRFSCKWLIENNGSLFWTSVRFHCVSGNLISEERQVSLPVCSPGEQIELEIPFSSPDEEGYFYSHWRLSHHGKGFGPTLKAECRVSYQQLVADKNVEVDSGAEDDEDLASADQGFALRAFPGAGDLQQPLIAISHEDYIDENLMQTNPTCDGDSIDLDATELMQDDSIGRPASSLFSEQEFLPDLQPDSSAQLSSSPNYMTSASINSDAASVTSSSADSFIVVQMPDSFDPSKPFYLKQGSEMVPASVVPESKETLQEDTPEFSSPEPIRLTTAPTHPTLSSNHGSFSYSPQPNVNVTCLSISPMSSIKSFVSSVVDKLDESFSRSPTPKQQPELFASTHEDFQFELPSCPSPEPTAPDPFLAQGTEQPPAVSFDMFTSTSSFTSSTFQPTDTTDFQFEVAPLEDFLKKKEEPEAFSEESFAAGDKTQWLSNSDQFAMNPHCTKSSDSWVAKNSSACEFDFSSNEEAWIAPGTNWKPKKPVTPNEHLMKMGFCNRTLNLKLLETHSGNIEQVVASLVDENKSAWPVNNI